MRGIELHWINGSSQGPTKYSSRNAAGHRVVVIEHGKSKTISRSASALQSLIVNELSETIYFPSAKVISRQHARIHWRDDDAVIEEQGSTHGTYVAQRNARLGADGDWIELSPEAKLVRVNDVAYLRPGDYVELGKECGSGANGYQPVRLYVSAIDDRKQQDTSLKLSNRSSTTQVGLWDGSPKTLREPTGPMHPTIGLSELDEMSDYDQESDDLRERPDLDYGTSEVEDKTSTPSESPSEDSHCDLASEANRMDSLFTEASSFADALMTDGSLLQGVEPVDEIPPYAGSEAEHNKATLKDSAEYAPPQLPAALDNVDGRSSISLPQSKPVLSTQVALEFDSDDVIGAASIAQSKANAGATGQAIKRSAEDSTDSDSETDSSVSSSPPTICASTSSSPRPIKRIRTIHAAKRSHRHHHHHEHRTSSLRTVGKILRGAVYTASLFSIGFLSGSVFTFKAVMNTASQISAPSVSTI